jgi:SprT-like family
VTADDYSLRLIAALTNLWNAIRERHDAVPPVVLLPAPSQSRRMNVLGHFAPLRWKAPSSGDEGRIHEVVVVAEHLDRGADDILETLLHEAAHAMNFARGVHDCSRSQYHNERFKCAAEELGLDVKRVPHYGFASTTLPKTTAALYQRGVVELHAVLIHRRKAVTLPAVPTGGDTPTTSDGEDGPRSRHLKATCACPLVIRASRKTLVATTIRCETCGEPFRASA